MTASTPTSSGGKTPSSNDSDNDSPDRHSGFIIVRLVPDLPLPSNESQTLLEAANELGLSELEKLLNNFGLVDSTRLILSLEPQKILKLEKQAGETVLPPPCAV